MKQSTFRKEQGLKLRKPMTSISTHKIIDLTLHELSMFNIFNLSFVMPIVQPFETNHYNHLRKDANKDLYIIPKFYVLRKRFKVTTYISCFKKNIWRNILLLTMECCFLIDFICLDLEKSRMSRFFQRSSQDHIL